MKPFGWLTGACLLAALTGCTAQQLYASGQSWKRNECFKLVDNIQRNQCLAQTWVSYDQYQRQLRADHAGRAESALP